MSSGLLQIASTPLDRSRSRNLHRASIVIDGTCPDPYWSENFEKWIAGDADCCVVTIGWGESRGDAVRNIAQFYKLLRDNDERLTLATTTDEIRQAKANGKLAVVLQFQGTYPIEQDLNLIELYWRLGLRVIQLTYNVRCAVGDGCEEPGNAGLSEFGRLVVGELNRLRVAVDLAHTGVRTSLDAIELSTSPCVVSHANCRSVHENARNLSDELIRAIAEKGGVIGLNGFPAFITPKRAPTLDDLIDHLVHIDSIAGSGHAALGLDYCGQDMTMSDYEKLVSDGWWRPENYTKPPYTFPAGIENPSTLNQLTDRLVERGYTDEEVRGVLGENWMRVYDLIWSKE